MMAVACVPVHRSDRQTQDGRRGGCLYASLDVAWQLCHVVGDEKKRPIHHEKTSLTFERISHTARMETLLRLFPSTLSPDVHVRRASEQELHQLESQPGMLAASFQLVASPEVDASIRQAAAIYVKNRVSRTWDASLARGFSDMPSAVSDQDKEVVRSGLLPTIASLPPTLRVHIASAMYSIVRCDFPQAWPTLTEEIVKVLSSGEQLQIFAGVRALLELVRAFRFDCTDSKLESIVSHTFPALLATVSALMDSDHSDLPAVGEIVYYAMKTYKTSMMVTLTQHQQSNESIVPWGSVMLRIVQKSVVTDADADADAREKAPWWKAKKWAFYSLNKLFSRYGTPSQLAASMKMYKPFAETFIHNFAPEILKAYLHTADGIVSQHVWVSKPVLRHLLTFFSECIRPKSMWQLLRPHIQQIIETLVYPHLCFSDEDEELWELDPIDFVRLGSDPFEELGTPSSAASMLLNVTVTRRTKSMFEPTLTFITHVLNAYPAQCTARQFDGALRMCMTICQTMVHHENVQNMLDAFFVQHVLPVLKSPEPFLRLRACALIHAFDSAGMKWQTSQSLETAFRGVMDCIMDTELPVRVKAAEAMGELVAHDEVHNAVAPNACRLMQELLKLSDETDLDVLMTTQEKIVNNFAEELLPFSVDLTQQMANNYMRLLQDNLAGAGADGGVDGVHAFNMDQGEEDKYFAAMGCLSTMYQMVTTADSRPDILAELEKVLLPVVAFTIQSETLDLYDDCFQLTDVLTYYQKSVSPAMWDIFTLMYKSFKSSGIDYLSEMIGTFDNCASYGTEMLRQHAEYRHMLIDIFHTAISSDQLVSSDRIAACQIAEVVLLLLRGYVDDAVPGILTALLPFLDKATESHLLRKWAALIVLESMYYNPTLSLSILESHGATQAFFATVLPMLTKCRRVHECKVAIVALLSLLAMDPQSVPPALRNGYPHLFGALLTQLKALPKLVAQRKELHKVFDEGLDDLDDDVNAALDEFDDDADVQEDDNDYLQLLAEEANRVRAQVHIADGDAPADDGIGSADDLEDDFDDDDLVYESPLESVPVYEPFRAVIRQLQTQQADLFQSLTASLNEQQQQDLQQVYDLQDSEDTGTSA